MLAPGLAARREVLETWQRWGPLRGRALSCGHFLPEEAPDDTLAELTRFFQDVGRPAAGG
jgi:haloacetate dehalogenase